MKGNSKETDRVKELSKFAIKFANTVFVLGILFSVIVAVRAVYRIYYLHESITFTFYYSFLLFAVLSAALFVLGLRRLRDEFKVNLSVLLITVVISVYGFETFLQFSSNFFRKAGISNSLYDDQQMRKAIAEQMGIPYDTRTKMEVLEDLRDSGVEAYPHIYPSLFAARNGLTLDGKTIYPLGGISNVTTILGNEAGYYPIIERDEHGFNNPKGLYNKN